MAAEKLFKKVLDQWGAYQYAAGTAVHDARLPDSALHAPANGFIKRIKCRYISLVRRPGRMSSP